MSREQWLAGRPVLTPENELACNAWQWCGGWKPALFQAAAAYYGIEDLDALIGSLLLIRGAVDAHLERKREAK